MLNISVDPLFGEEISIDEFSDHIIVHIGKANGDGVVDEAVEIDEHEQMSPQLMKVKRGL